MSIYELEIGDKVVDSLGNVATLIDIDHDWYKFSFDREKFTTLYHFEDLLFMGVRKITKLELALK